MKRYLILVFIALTACVSQASARELTVASWNLGWHMDKALAASWIAKCGQTFEKDPTTGIWTPTTTPSSAAKTGWNIDVYGKTVWDKVNDPVCNVYRAPGVVPVTVTSYDKRDTQIASFIANSVKPDIIAFEEVSGEQAIKEVLPDGGKNYLICSFTAYKVQRIAIAWKAEFGPASECTTDDAMTIPSNPIDTRVRPGLTAELTIDGQKVRIMALHLKSRCVSIVQQKLDDATDPNCSILQQQAVPFENWIESKTADTNKVILLGDFNRNFWLEAASTADVRTDGSDPTTALPSGAKVLNLFKEVFDGMPSTSRLTILPEACPLNATTNALCALGETRDLTQDELNQLRDVQSLGCGNPIGLDHIMVGSGLTVTGSAEKVPLGKYGRTLRADLTHPDPLLSLSDHCPIIAHVSF